MSPIADNRRIQVFDNNGKFKTQFINVGTPWTLCMTPGPHQYLYSSNSNDPREFDKDGEIYKMELDGRIVGRFGRAGRLAEGVQHRARDRLPQRERAVRRRAHQLARAEAAAQIGGRW